MKVDLRVVKTHQAIRNALLNPLAERDYDDIAAQDIIATAQVNRATFYKYYSGKNAVAAAMIAEFKQDYAANLAERLAADNLPDFLQQSADALFKQHALLLALWKIQTPKLHLYDDMRAMLQTHFAAMLPETAPDDYRVKIMATLLLETVRHFFERRQAVPVARVLEEMAAVMRLVRAEAV